MKTVGIDFGYGYVKYYDGNKKEKVISLVAPSRRIKFSMKEDNLLNHLDVEVDGGRFFVGDLAKKQGIDPYQVLDKDKIFHPTTKIMILTTLASFNNSEINIVTGLPVSYYDEEKVKYLKDLLLGEHQVIFHEGIDSSKNVSFKIKDVIVIPQPVGSYFDAILSNTGTLPKEKEKIANSTVAVVDIGFGTTDFAVIKNLEYIDKSSRSISIGVKDILEYIREELAVDTKEEFYLYEIEEFLSKGEIPLRGKKVDIKPYIERATAVIFSKIKTISDYLWDKEKAIDYYLVTGGGSYLLGKHFNQTYKDRTSMIYPVAAEFANVIGFYKYGLRKWR